MRGKRARIFNIFNLSPSRPESPVQLPASTASATSSTSASSSRSSATTQNVTVPSTVTSTASSQNQLNQPPFPTGVKVAWEGVKTALLLLKESSDWLPPLKGAIGGLIALIGAIELTCENAANLEILRQKMDGLTSIIKENSKDRTFPWLRRRLSEFAENLNELVKCINEKSNHGSLRRFAEVKRDKEDIAAFATTLSDLVTNLQSELMLYTSHGINELLSSESLKKLKESETARYDALLSTELVQRRGCTPNTRQKILEDLMAWAKDSHSSRMYWMSGMAGTGKTTIAYSFCEQLQVEGLLGANFFCSRSLAECSDIRYIIPTVVRQLARSCPQFASALLEVLGGDFQLPSFRNQHHRLLSEPFQRISVNDTLIVVIDALDECNNEASDIRLFLKLIYDSFLTKGIPLKIFVTSRPEDVISRTITPFKPSSPSEWSVVRIHDIEESLVQADIKNYIEDELAEIAETWGLEDGWPPGTEVDVIVGNANKLFIYAATVIRYVKEDSGDPRRRLSELGSTPVVGKKTSTLTTELIDGLYKAILERALYRSNVVEIRLARTILKLIVCAQTPLTLAGVADLLSTSGECEIEISTSDVRTALKLLHSVISVPMGGDGVATTFHASFADFLFDSHRCGSVNHLAFRQSHQELARMCLRFMDRSSTVDNICGLDRWQGVDAVPIDKIDSWISNALAYACMFWASHIDTDDEIENLSIELDSFLTRQVLRWLVVLGFLRRLDIGVEILRRMKECKHPTLSSKFDDAYKFLKDILEFVNVWPCEVFHSGLVWAPEQSFIGRTYLQMSPTQMLCGRRSSWDACEQTIRGHLQEVKSVAVSPDNRRIVSGSSDNTIRIWNASTGVEDLVLQGHLDVVNSVTISSDNRRVVSGSRDESIRIWNASTGEVEHILQGHSDGVTSVALSPDNRHVVSGSQDKTIRIWNTSTGDAERVFRGHSGDVNSVAVSPDNRHVVSGSDDMTVRIWNISTGEEVHVLQGHSDSVVSVAVSPDNLRVISGSRDKTVRIWSSSTGEEEQTLQHPDAVYSVAISPDNRHIVSGCLDETVRIWEASTGKEGHVFRGHSGWVGSVAVSLDNRHVVSGSWDNTVRIWNMSTDEEHIVQGHSGMVFSIALSPDNCHVISGSQDNTVRVWNASTGKEEHVLEGHSGWVSSVVVSPDNHHIVSGSRDATVRIWNASTGQEVRVLRGHFSDVNSVVVSPDNHHVVSGSDDTTVRIWNISTGEEVHVLQGHSEWVMSVNVSPDNCRVVSGSLDETVRIWNASTGEEEQVVQHSASVYSVAFSLDNSYVVSGSKDNTVRIWKVSTGIEEPPWTITFVLSPHNCYVMFGLQSDTLEIGRIFLSSMVTSVALLAQGGNISSIPVLQRLASDESLDLEDFLREMGNGSSPVPITLAPDGISILLSNGKRCLAIPSAVRDISCAAFSGMKVCFGHGFGGITSLDIST